MSVRNNGDRRPRKRRTGIRMLEVAKSAGVSMITVSRALRTPEKVAAHTRKRIERVIQNLQYVPDMAAGTLASTRSRIIAVIVPNVANSVFADTLQGMSEMLHAAGYHLLIGYSGYSLAEEESLVRAFLARRPEGIILTGCTHRRKTVELVRSAAIPVIEMWNTTKHPIDTVVGFSNFEAARAMTLHLGRKGYKRFGYIGGLIDNNDRTKHREAGFLAALSELGLRFNRSLMVRAPFEFVAGAVALKELLSRSTRFDVIFAAADILAIGVILECQRRNWNIPEHFAVAGFDDTPLASQIIPAVTTVRVPRYEIGKVAAEQMLLQIQGQSGDRKMVDLGFQIIERDSA